MNIISDLNTLDSPSGNSTAPQEASRVGEVQELELDHDKRRPADDLDGLISNLNIETDGNDARALLKSWLGKIMRVVIADGRVIIGGFVCTDRDGNVILENSDEYWFRIGGKYGIQTLTKGSR